MLRAQKLFGVSLVWVEFSTLSQPSVYPYHQETHIHLEVQQGYSSDVILGDDSGQEANTTFTSPYPSRTE